MRRINAALEQQQRAVDTAATALWSERHAAREEAGKVLHKKRRKTYDAQRDWKEVRQASLLKQEDECR